MNNNHNEIMNYIDKCVHRIPDFPEKGVLFYDFSGVLNDTYAWPLSVSLLSKEMGKYSPDLVMGLEARGFVFAAPLALNHGTGLVLARKKGKVPGETISASYGMEYGHKTIEISTLAIKKGQKVVIVDDLLATGGTALAAIDLVEKAGGIVSAVLFAIELKSFNARAKFKVPVFSLLQY
jgi:adenine phosphoribosyltransferase